MHDVKPPSHQTKTTKTALRPENCDERSAVVVKMEKRTVFKFILRRYYVLIKFLLRPDSTASSLYVFLTCPKFDHVLHVHGDHITSLSVSTAFLLYAVQNSYCVHPIFGGRSGNVAGVTGVVQSPSARHIASESLANF